MRADRSLLDSPITPAWSLASHQSTSLSTSFPLVPSWSAASAKPTHIQTHIIKKIKDFFLLDHFCQNILNWITAAAVVWTIFWFYFDYEEFITLQLDQSGWKILRIAAKFGRNIFHTNLKCVQTSVMTTVCVLKIHFWIEIVFSLCCRFSLYLVYQWAFVTSPGA